MREVEAPAREVVDATVPLGRFHTIPVAAGGDEHHRSRPPVCPTILAAEEVFGITHMI